MFLQKDNHGVDSISPKSDLGDFQGDFKVTWAFLIHVLP